MRLWTAQPESVLEQVMEEGAYRADPRQMLCLKDEAFKRAYAWLIGEMEKRIGKRPEGVSYPVWAFALYDGDPKEPEERYFGEEGDEFYMLALDIPKRDIVLTDHGLWHYVLNDWNIGDATTEEEWKKEEDAFWKLSLKERERRTRRSWQKIFDTGRTVNEFFSTGMFVQATFWELKKEDVISARRFIVPPAEE